MDFLEMFGDLIIIILAIAASRIVLLFLILLNKAGGDRV